MITENEVRDLLVRAAGTIEVPPGAVTVVRPSRPRWVVPMVAALAVLIALAAGVAISDRHHATNPGPAHVVPAPQMPKDRIPSVFAYDSQSAVRLLHERGLSVRLRAMRPGCVTAGRADHTEPRAGTKFTGGETVTLFFTTSTQGLCGGTGDLPAWTLLDFVNGRGPAPQFAPKVQAYVNDQHTELTGAEAFDRRTWGQGTALGALATLISKTDVPNFVFSLPTLYVSAGRPQTCDLGTDDVPPSLRDRPAYRMRFVVPSPGIINPCFAVDEFRDSRDRIDAILVRVPDFAVHPPAPEPTPDQGAVAAQFLAFARGTGDAPKFSRRLRLYLGNVGRQSISAERARSGSWPSICKKSDELCRPSAIDVLGDPQFHPVVIDSLGSCVRQLSSPLNPQQTHAFHHVTFGLAEPRSCIDDWAVEIWYDNASRITAVNLLVGSP